MNCRRISTHSSMNSTNYRRRRDAEGVRPRSGPIGNREFVDVVMSSDANSFEIEFVRLSAFQIAIFRRISITKRHRNRDFEQTTSSSDAFGVGPLRGRTTSSSDAFGVAPSAIILQNPLSWVSTILGLRTLDQRFKLVFCIEFRT